MIDEISTIMAVATATIGVIATIYKILFKNDNKRTEKYYKKILKPFIIEYHKKGGVDVIDFLNKKAERDNDAIPKYIFFLKDKGECKSEELKKILLYDYTEFYPNNNNKMAIFMGMISKFLVYLSFAVSVSCLLYGGLCFCFGFILLLQNFLDYKLYIGMFIISIICFAVSIVGVQLTKLIDDDMYTLNEKRIRMIIQRKLDSYNKNSYKYIF